MRRIGLLGLMLAVFTTSPVYATVFWEDDFEGSPPFADGGTWGPIGACPSQPEGCTPFGPYRTTEQAHSGTHSLKSHYEFACGMVNGGGTCGAHITRSHAFTNNVYMRWWLKFVNGQINPIAGSKLMYNKANPNGLALQPFYTVISHIFQGTTTLAAIAYHNGYNSFCPQPGNGTGQDQACNIPTNQPNAIDLTDGNWHCVETHVDAGTAGNYDGLIEGWVDGVLQLRHTGVAVKGNVDINGTRIQSDSQFEAITHYAQLGNGDRYIDQLAVGDSRIGCGNLSVQSPSPPATLLVR